MVDYNNNNFLSTKPTSFLQNFNTPQNNYSIGANNFMQGTQAVSPYGITPGDNFMQNSPYNIMGNMNTDIGMDVSSLNSPVPDWMQNNGGALGGTGNSSWLNKFKGGLGVAVDVFNIANAGMNAYLGYKQLGVAEDTLDFQKDAFSSQFEMQRADVNRRLEDRQRSRVSASGANAMSVDDYMKKYEV
jgi:hypothetical protein